MEVTEALTLLAPPVEPAEEAAAVVEVLPVLLEEQPEAVESSMAVLRTAVRIRFLFIFFSSFFGKSFKRKSFICNGPVECPKFFGKLSPQAWDLW